MAMYHRHVSLDKPNNVKYEYDMLIFLEYVKPEYIIEIGLRLLRM